MSVPYELAVIEDLATGYGTRSVSMPAGGSATGNKIHRGNIPAPSSRCGLVTVYPPILTEGKGIVFGPSGEEVSTAASTTAGLQEAINYADTHGCDLEILGGDEGPTGNKGAVYYVINAGVTLEFPPMQGKSIRIGAATITANGSTAATMIRFDSCMMVCVECSGTQFAYSNRTGSNLRFNPRNPVPLDGLTTIIDSYFRFGTVGGGAGGGAGSSCVYFDPTGSISQNTFIFNELGYGDQAIIVITPTGSPTLNRNLITAQHIHDHVTALPTVQVGASAGSTNTQIVDNWWNLSINTEAGARGFDTRATRDRGFIRRSAAAGSGFPDIYFEATAAGADLDLSTPTTVLADQVIDASTAQNNCVRVQQTSVGTSVTATGSPMTFPNATKYYARDCRLLVQGGTVSKIELGDGTTWFDTGATNGSFPCGRGLFVRVTYSSAPTMTCIVRN